MMKTLGILGGGQLATMMCEAADRIGGLSTWVLSPDAQAPAQQACDRFVCAEYEDPAALDQLAAQCDVITVDNEHIPAAALERLERTVTVRPSAAVLGTIQDRLVQREMLAGLDAPQPRFWPVGDEATLNTAIREATFPGVLKSRRGGYDGRGQVVVSSAEELASGWAAIGRQPAVLEAFVNFRCEVSLVGARAADGTNRYYPLVVNEHREGQLWRTDLPATEDAALGQAADDIWQRIAEHFDYVGVMAVEFFVDPDGGLLVNEIAPRVHNSGHATQQASDLSQFDLHVRAVMDRPLPDPAPFRPTVMLNLYGDHGIDDDATARSLEATHGGRIVLYGKEPRPRRKTGHWLLDPGQAAAAQACLEDRFKPL